MSPAAHQGLLPAARPAGDSRLEVDSAREAATRGDNAEGAAGVCETLGCSAAWERWRLRRFSGRASD